MAFKRKYAGRAGRVVRRRVMRTGFRGAVRRAAAFGMRRAVFSNPYTAGAAVVGAAGYGLYRRRKAKMIGNRPGAGSAKRRLIEGYTVINTKTLSGNVRLLAIPRQTDGDEAVLNTRQRNVVNFRGLKICVQLDLQEVTGSTGDNVYVNFALVSPKNQYDKDATIGTDEFFRGQDGSRFTDFTGANLTGLDCRCLPINADKYIIHTHKRMKMGPWESTEGKGEKTFEFYHKLGRQVPYNTTGTADHLTYPEGRDIWMVYWCAEASEGLGTPTTGLLGVRYRILQYFREPKN